MPDYPLTLSISETGAPHARGFLFTFWWTARPSPATKACRLIQDSKSANSPISSMNNSRAVISRRSQTITACHWRGTVQALAASWDKVTPTIPVTTARTLLIASDAADF
ncbi:MAG: hypothetical protein ABI977_25655 [Acidobacteriota bacterium]